MSADSTKSRPSVLAFLAVAIVVVVALMFFYSSSARKDTELAALRADLQNQLAQAEQTRAEEAAAHKAELERLREENAALSRLREEVRQLRDDAQQKQAQAQGVQTYVAAAQLQQQEKALKLLEAAQQSEAQKIQREACISTLRLIDKAKQNWASRRFNTTTFSSKSFSPGEFWSDHNKIADTIPPYNEIATYFNGSVLPTCPAGGSYTINAVKAAPSCSIAGHVLPE
jgi:hypothetical protein